MKKKVFIWGAGGTGKKVYHMIKQEVDVLGFIDMNEQKQNTTLEGHTIFSQDILKNGIHYDAIAVGTLSGDAIPKTLEDMGIKKYYLDTTYIDIMLKSRITFLKYFSEMIKDKHGAVAEAGVFRGDFAKYINEFFPESDCYLFDTFEGFCQNDFSYEKHLSDISRNDLTLTSQQLVYNKMPNKEKVTILKGYFPETVTDEILNKKFLFVNLDMDLYKPTLEGLKIFYPRMVEGGIILVHDYFNENYPNIKEAITDFEKETCERLHKMPIGDGISIAIVK